MVHLDHTTYNNHHDLRRSTLFSVFSAAFASASQPEVHWQRWSRRSVFAYCSTNNSGNHDRLASHAPTLYLTSTNTGLDSARPHSSSTTTSFRRTSTSIIFINQSEMTLPHPPLDCRRCIQSIKNRYLTLTPCFIRATHLGLYAWCIEEKVGNYVST